MVVVSGGDQTTVAIVQCTVVNDYSTVQNISLGIRLRGILCNEMRRQQF